jgi:hypothetical protein
MLKYEKDVKVGNNKPIEAGVLHERAREASLESRKLLISLSTGLLAFTFFVLIGKELKDISVFLRILLSINFFIIAISLICGVIAWIADGRRNYFKAKEIQTHKNNKKYKKIYGDKYKVWKKQRKVLETILRYGFLSSIIIYAIFILIYLINQ